MSIFTVSFQLLFLLSHRTHVVLRYAHAHSLCALPQSSMGVTLRWRARSARFVVCLQRCPSLSYVVRILTCDTGRQHSSPFGPCAGRSGQRWRPTSPSKPVGLRAQCDKEGSGSESTGEFVVVATSTRKGKGNGVGKEPVRRSKRARHLPLHDASNGGDTCPEWCHSDSSLPVRMQQARCHRRAISCAGLLACRRLLGLSAHLLVNSLAWRLLVGLSTCWLSGSLACCLAHSLARWLLGLSAAFWLIASLFAHSAALWLVGGIVACRLVARSVAL